MIHQARIVFMGSPEFSVPTLKALAACFPVVGIVTQPDRPAGRGGAMRSPAVKRTALLLGIPVIQPEKVRAPEAMEQLRAWAPDLIVVAAFGQILRQELLDLPSYGCLNLHGSILPRWRGAAPVQAAILAGDRETGVSLMRMDAGVDTGPLLRQRYVPIHPEDTAVTLFERLASMGADLLLESLPAYLAGEIMPQVQPEQGVTYAPLLKKEDGLLDFSLPAASLERRVRALNPWPGTFFPLKEKPLKVLRARIASGTNPAPGAHLVVNGWPAVGTPAGLLVLEEVQPAGKRPMPGKAFLAGVQDW